IELYEFALDNAREAGMPPEDLVHRLEEIAQLAELRLGDIPRAVEAWQRIAQYEPHSPKVAEALRRLNARGKMWEQLVSSLEHELQKLQAQMARQGKSSESSKDWPVAKRSERLTVLRRLAQIYETRLADVDGVVYACGAVLELLSGDRDALDRMERVLDKAND